MITITYRLKENPGIGSFSDVIAEYADATDDEKLCFIEQAKVLSQEKSIVWARADALAQAFRKELEEKDQKHRASLHPKS